MCAAPVGHKCNYAVSWLLIPIVVWREAFPNSNLAMVVVILWGMACISYVMQEFRTAAAKRIIAEQEAMRIMAEQEATRSNATEEET